MQPPSDESDEVSAGTAKDSILGARLSIDYVAAGEDATRVELYFDRDEGLDIDSLVAAVENQLGLRPGEELSGPAIAAIATIDPPLDLGDLLSDYGQVPIDGEAADGEAAAPIGPAGATLSEDMLSFWLFAEDPIAHNDNDVTTDL